MKDNTKLNGSEDSILIRQFISGGGNEAFITLVKRHTGIMRNVLYTVLGGNREDIEDAEQEILMALYTNIRKFRFGSSFSTYFYRFCRNKGIDYLRKKTRNNKIIKAFRELPEKEISNPEKEYLKKEQKNEFNSILFKLKEEERSLLLLKDIEKLSIKEISAIFRLPEGTIKSRLHRVREKAAGMIKKGSVI